MKYYLIKMSDDLKIIGHYPQADYRKGYNPKKEGSFNIKIDEFPDFIPNMELQLHQNSIPTDYLGMLGLPFGIIISPRMKEILEKHKLPRCHFYKTKVHHKDEFLNYYWFHYIVDDFWKFIDKDESFGEVLDIKQNFSVRKKIPVISSEQNKKEVMSREKGCIKKIGKIKMKKDFPQYDLYKTRFIESRTIVSETLKKAIEEAGLTGMEIKPFEKFVVST